MSFQNAYAPAPPTIWPYPLSIWVSGGPKAGAMVEEICGQPNAGVVFQGSSTVGVLLASMPQIVSLPNSLSVSAYRTSEASRITLFSAPVLGLPVTWMNEPRLP